MCSEYVWVYDSNGDPIEGATVDAYYAYGEYAYSATSRATGRAMVPLFSGTDYYVIVTMPGYSTFQSDVFTACVDITAVLTGSGNGDGDGDGNGNGDGDGDDNGDGEGTNPLALLGCAIGLGAVAFAMIGSRRY